MKTKDFLQLFRTDALTETLLVYFKDTQVQKIQLKGIIGSQDAVIAGSVYQAVQQNHIFILHDKEEASYFTNDLQHLLGNEKEVLFFPTSYKRPYEYTHVENANVLMRAEVLNKINQKNEDFLLVTYPEALSEKVINRKSLIENTFLARKGEKLDMDFLNEFLMSYSFEKTDFVYEAGQFSIRGGIIDIFSYANDLPYRIELVGNEIESIRVFEPETQLSVENIDKVAIIPNVQKKLLHEVRETFLEFIPKNTSFWIKDVALTLDVIGKSFDNVSGTFQEMMEESGNMQIISKPELLFETRESFEKQLDLFKCVEFGKKFYYTADKIIQFSAAPQPSFNKDFAVLADNLNEFQNKGFTNIISSESFKQTERLKTIFTELDKFLKTRSLPIGLREGFIDKNLKIVCYTDHQIFERFYRYHLKEKNSKSKALTLKELRTLQPGDFVTHIDYGIGRFAGLEKSQINGKQQEVIRLVYRDDDLLLINIHSLHKIAKYTGKEGSAPVISKLGSGDWENKKRKAKKQVQDIAKELIELYAKRKSSYGFAFSPDGYLQAELESSFLYEDTPDQAKATTQVKEDMEQSHPMDRLVCGDVGFGKTEIAIRAAFKSVCDSKQVAVLVPTTVLAMQHFKTFSERLGKLPCKVEYVSRFRSPQQIKATLQNIAEGKTDILIGTHRIVNKDVKFKDLGLLIIDEEQKFGVKTKEKIKEIKIDVDVLTLTATPIPRTLHFSLMGARDLSIIGTPPPNRQPVTTEMHTFNEHIIRDAVSHEIRRGGQVFFVHNRVNDIESIANLILRLVPDARIGVAHGQMDGSRLEKAMMKFIEGEYDVLVSTNIIESGLDIPNANTIMINMAHTFGLSDLHQMRGRVGRSNKKAFCYLLTPATSLLSTDARKRLSALEEFSDLGDGFKVAMRDLDIRGAGNLLGAEQSGFISDLGFEMYHKILDEAIQELKETQFKDLFIKELTEKDLGKIKTDCIIETDLQLLIPDNYVKNISERLNLYNQLDNIKDMEALKNYEISLVDRFGQLPDEVKDLIETVKLRWIAEDIGFEKLTLKNDILKGYFISDNDKYFNSETFGKVIKFVQENHKKARLTEVNKKAILIFNEINSIQQAISILSSINQRYTSKITQNA